MGGLSSLRRLEAYALFCVRYPHPKSLPSGKGLALALAGSKSGVSHLRNLSKINHFERYLRITKSFISLSGPG